MLDIMPENRNRPSIKLASLYKNYLKVQISYSIVKERANGFQVSLFKDYMTGVM